MKGMLAKTFSHFSNKFRTTIIVHIIYLINYAIKSSQDIKKNFINPVYTLIILFI